MKRLPIPDYDDVKIIKKLSTNKRLKKTSYPELKDSIKIIISGYEHYIKKKGNVWDITVDILPLKLKSGLLKNYDGEPGSLNYLTELRNSSLDICPMCGSEGAVNLDHILTKENHHQWAVFSKNLVPACDCNNKRGTALTGDVSKRQRILHPYFDDCLKERLLSCNISPDANFRLADIELKYMCEYHPQFESIKYHVEEVVLKRGLLKWLDERWVKLRANPSVLIQTIPIKIIDSIDELSDYLIDSIGRFDKATGTPNNWNSIFVHGVLTSPSLIEWLLGRHNEIVGGGLDPRDN
jgi:hypothetical protein